MFAGFGANVVAVENDAVFFGIPQDVVIAVKEGRQDAQRVAGARHEYLQSQCFKVAHGGNDVAQVHFDEGFIDNEKSQAAVIAPL